VTSCSRQLSPLVGILSTHWVALAVVGRIHARARRARRHGLVGVFPVVELLLVLIVVHALDHLGPHERRLGHDALERHHVVQLVRAERARIARVFAEAANVRTVVLDIFGRLGLGAVGKCLHNVLEGPVEGHGEVERVVQEAVGEFAVVCPDFVYADLRDVSTS
jgi:hypothetical protein